MVKRVPECLSLDYLSRYNVLCSVVYLNFIYGKPVRNNIEVLFLNTSRCIGPSLRKSIIVFVSLRDKVQGLDRNWSRQSMLGLIIN